MRTIFEQLDREDFFEIIISADEYEKLLETGIVRDYPNGLSRRRNLNIYLWVDKKYDDENMPTMKGKK